MPSGSLLTALFSVAPPENQLLGLPSVSVPMRQPWLLLSPMVKVVLALTSSVVPASSVAGPLKFDPGAGERVGMPPLKTRALAMVGLAMVLGGARQGALRC